MWYCKRSWRLIHTVRPSSVSVWFLFYWCTLIVLCFFMLQSAFFKYENPVPPRKQMPYLTLPPCNSHLSIKATFICPQGAERGLTVPNMYLQKYSLQTNCCFFDSKWGCITFALLWTAAIGGLNERERETCLDIVKLFALPIACLWEKGNIYNAEKNSWKWTRCTSCTATVDVF